MLNDQVPDPVERIARQIADSLAENGHAFVEDDRLEALTGALAEFLANAGITIDTAR